MNEVEVRLSDVKRREAPPLHFGSAALASGTLYEHQLFLHETCKNLTINGVCHTTIMYQMIIGPTNVLSVAASQAILAKRSVLCAG